MAKGDITILRSAQFGDPGSKRYQVASGAAATINPGELVLKALGSAAVVAWGNTAAKPVVGTDFIGGLSASTSTDTASAAGTVDVVPILPGMVFLIVPNVAATWNTQAKYNALVGARVLLNSGSVGGQQTILAADGSTNGLVVEDLNIAEKPVAVAFTVRSAANYFA